MSRDVPPPHQALLHVDIGQTASRAVVRIGARSRVISGEGLRAGDDPEELLHTIVLGALAGESGHPVTVRAAMTGLHGRTPDPWPHLQAWSDVGVVAVDLVDDSVAGYLGALGTGPGVVLSVGTGVCGLACGRSGQPARVDGWGHLLGDRGGGFWIGRRAMAAVLRGVDGCGPRTLLGARLVDAFGPVEELPRRLQADPRQVARVAEFAPVVVETALAGDAVALDLCQRAGAELAASARVAAGRVEGLTRPVAVSWTGSLLGGNELLRREFERAVVAEPGFRLVDPRGGLLDGVATLADIPPNHPLSLLVGHAQTVEAA